MSEVAFSRRVVWLLGLVAALSFLASLVFGMLGAQVREEQSNLSDTFSRSAIGHHALLSLLKGLNIPVTVSRFATGRRAGEGSVVLLLEPQVEAEGPTARDLPDLIQESSARDVIVVLPKWHVRGWPTESDVVDRVDRRADDANAVLHALDLEAHVRLAEGPWQSVGGVAPSLSFQAQVIEGGQLTPLISNGSGVLVGKVETLGHTLTLVADPDLVNNAGLLTHPNAELVLNLLADVVGERTLMIDETLHGFTQPEDVWVHLLRFPLVLVTLQVGLVLVLVLWAGMRRFGAAVPMAAALGRGRRVLVENTAQLLWYGGHNQDALSRYWADSVRDVAERLHAPPRLDRGGVLGWLDSVGHGKQLVETTGELEAAVITAGADAERILAAARRVQQWRMRMLG